MRTARTPPPTSEEAGIVLLALIGLVMIVITITGSVLFVSVTHGKAITEATQRQTAFYLAEGGIEAAKWEIGESKDPEGDGVGTKRIKTSAGTYTVVAEDVGGGNYELTSTGNCGLANVTLRAMVGRPMTTTFPYSAVSMIGGASKLDVKFKKKVNLVLTGDDSSAIGLTDKDLYEEIGQEFAEAVVKKEISATGLTGQPMSNFHGDKKTEVKLPIHLHEGFPDTLSSYTDLYNDLVSTVQGSIIPKTTVFKRDPTDPKKPKGPESFTFGSETSPANIYISEHVHLDHKESVTGHGTLVIADHFHIQSGSSFNWDGDVIIVGDEKKSAKLEIDGVFNVTGNVIVLGEGREAAELKVKHKSQAVVNGSVFIGTEEGEKSKKVKLEADGELTVNGLLTMVGSRVEAKFKHESEFTVNGMFQFAVPSHHKKDKMKLEFEGDVTVVRDSDLMYEGAETLSEMGVRYQLEQAATIVKKGMVTYGWLQVAE